MYNVYYVSLHFQSTLHFIVLLCDIFLFHFPSVLCITFCYFALCECLFSVLFSNFSMNLLYLKAPDCVHDIYSWVFRVLLFALH